MDILWNQRDLFAKDLKLRELKEIFSFINWPFCTALLDTEKSTSMSQNSIALDQLFDMDMALTLPPPPPPPENSSSEVVKPAESSPEVYPSHRIQESLPTVNTGDGVCTVCMEGFEFGVGGKQLPCDHIFHQNCLSKWLSLHKSCPLCRFKVSGVSAGGGRPADLPAAPAKD